MRKSLKHIKEEIGKLSTLKPEVTELKLWQRDRDMVISLSQVKQMIQDVNGLVKFKTTAITIWIGVQFLTGIILALLKYME